MNPERFDLFDEPLAKGFAKAGGGKSLANFDLAPIVTVVLGDDIEACRGPIKAMMALYIGGMGAKGKNFYNDYAKRLGYEEAAERIQELYLAGKKGEACNAVPDQLVDDVASGAPRRELATGSRPGSGPRSARSRSSPRCSPKRCACWPSSCF